eukprot:gnl/TRDRNA2_/TRDRNA2_41992_c0_seq2.p1 gnl/TRDRNA2_/TRDRNA2_41992_c0~~gnl/TRDRNA2_/TRDRNA2_41992_c0_seq2.p1  ORF type:complete len:692 (+),score=105.19 gnl/TRDRNA2_/TRDRNA2_41992_c0_seq2:289-2076(+)
MAAAAAADEMWRRKPSNVGCESLCRVELGKVIEFEEGRMREVKVDREGSGTSVLVHLHGGEFYVTATASSHHRIPLINGVSAGGPKGGPPTVTCSMHDAAFDLATGKAVRGPGRDGIATYKAEVAHGVLIARLPKSLADGKAEHLCVSPKLTKRNKRDGRTFALIGGGAAALAAAETLREEGFGGRIVMITQEPHFPYDRALLSKDLDKAASMLSTDVGKTRDDSSFSGSMFLRSSEYYEKADIEVQRESHVTKVDAVGQIVHYENSKGEKTELKYDKVLIATGSTPRKLSVPGSSLNGIYTVRTPEDVARILKHAKKGLKMIVVGGSFIGMEMASGLAKKGCDVAIISKESVPFESVLGQKVGASFARLLQREGLMWLGSTQVRLFRGESNVNGVELADGEVLPADAVIVGMGVVPNAGLVEGVSLDKDGALVVSPLLNSAERPTLFAAGDVCSYPALHTGQQVRLEHWNVAIEQGRTAARNMLGQSEPYSTIPFFRSQVLGKNLRFVGYAPDQPEMLDRVIVEGDISGMEFISYYVQGDEVRAVATVNRDPMAVASGELMRRGKFPKVSEILLGTVNADVILQRLRDLSSQKM